MENPIENIDKLLPYELGNLQKYLYYYNYHRDKKDYKSSDSFRNILKEWDSTLGILNGLDWYPIFETVENRNKRVEERTKRYNISIYPYT